MSNGKDKSSVRLSAFVTILVALIGATATIVTALVSRQPAEQAVPHQATSEPVTSQATKEHGPSSSPTAFPKSRATYICKWIGVNKGVRLEPEIPGSKTLDWSCFIPVSAGRCVARGGGNPYEQLDPSRDPSGLVNCDGEQITITDNATGEQFYQFNAVSGSVTFVLEK